MNKKKAYRSPEVRTMKFLMENNLLGSSTEKNKNTYSNDAGHIGMGTEKKSAIWGE